MRADRHVREAIGEEPHDERNPSRGTADDDEADDGDHYEPRGQKRGSRPREPAPRPAGGEYDEELHLRDYGEREATQAGELDVR